MSVPVRQHPIYHFNYTNLAKDPACLTILSEMDKLISQMACLVSKELYATGPCPF